MLPEALSFDSELSHAWNELYGVPGGEQVDGSAPVPVGPAGRGGQCDDFWVVLQKFERCLTIYFEKADFYAEH
eukprot:7644697-Pyramimonas_sp.AAC.1